jgi:hypothetical protein
MSWPTASELDHLVRRFRARTLPHSAWTHTAHLAVGTWHVRRLGREEALRQLRTRIRCLNDSHGTPNSDSRGYHETITRAYVWLIAEFLSGRPPSADTGRCVQDVLASPLAAKDVLLAYYSTERLFSVDARRRWLEPDKHALCVPPPPASA